MKPLRYWVATGLLGVAASKALSQELPERLPLVVFVTGDEEYRSEESMPMLAEILARDHGVRVTVLYSLAEDGTIDPNRSDHVPGTEGLAEADLMVMFTRFRALPEAQLQPILEYVASERPVAGFRTATHAFHYPEGRACAAELCSTPHKEGQEDVQDYDLQLLRRQ